MKALHIKNLGLIFLILLTLTSCTDVQLPHNKMVIDKLNQDLKSTLKVYPENTLPYQIVANKNITQVKRGDKNLYGILITQDFQDAYDGYLMGDGEKSLQAIQKIELSSNDPKELWQATF